MLLYYKDYLIKFRDASNIPFTDEENRILEETSENFNQNNLKKLQISEKPEKVGMYFY